MSTLAVLDPAELWLAKQFLGSNAITSKSNVSLFRMKLKKKILEEVRHLFRRAKVEPPIDLSEIAQYRRVLEIREDSGLVSKEACLLPTGGGFVITLNPRVRGKVRKRFNCAHEIAHTYFYDLTVDPPRKFHSSKQYWVEEGYAWEIAREMLVPEPHLSNYVLGNNLRFSVGSMVRLRNHFEVSYDLLARRLLHDAHSWNMEFWGNKAWQGLIIVLTLSPEESGMETSRSNTRVYRSPVYGHRLKDVTSRKLDKIVAEKAYQDKTVGLAPEEIAEVMMEAWRHKTQEKEFKQKQLKYCIQARKVSKRSVLATVCEIK
ncbi:ImmA/IrrE family metallo-endopeptidase [candidate division NPL-UPA2 bacterium]|nr:ImmA/IrrE family metallo-endopeptidase [candidate division NPL-UPA2 bacterium]